MPIKNRVSAISEDMIGIRHAFHADPELEFDVHRTAARVAELLRRYGCDEVVEGIGRTGVVGIIRGSSVTSGQVIGLRADMDALPMEEQTGLPYASKVPGMMHACGHDGHTTMLLGAARYLAESRQFNGTVAVIFQPAEEGGAGGREMVNDGMMERFGIDEVYGMHNWPGVPVGSFAITSGVIMASSDIFDITVTGKGGHAAMPHQCVDPVVVGAQLIVALQSIASRNTDPLDASVVSVTGMEIPGDAYNIIPPHVTLKGTVRALEPSTRDTTEAAVHRVAEHTALAMGATATVNYQRDYPATINAPAQTQKAINAAVGLVGPESVDIARAPSMGSEDFSFMLNERPGAFIFVGNGDSAGLHHPEYNFNDDAIAYGSGYWVELAESLLPV